MTTIFAFIFLVAVAIAASLLVILEQNLRRQEREEKLGNVIRMKRTLSAV
jgi:hypothetical protein